MVHGLTTIAEHRRFGNDCYYELPPPTFFDTSHIKIPFARYIRWYFLLTWPIQVIVSLVKQIKMSQNKPVQILLVIYSAMQLMAIKAAGMGKFTEFALM